MQPEPTPFSGVIRFADFEVALRSHELRRGGRKVRLQEKSFQVLNALLRTPGRVVTPNRSARSAPVHQGRALRSVNMLRRRAAVSMQRLRQISSL